MKLENTLTGIGLLLIFVGVVGWGLADVSYHPTNKPSVDSVEFKVFRAKDMYTGKLEPVYLDLNTIYRAGDSLEVNNNHVIPAGVGIR